MLGVDGVSCRRAEAGRRIRSSAEMGQLIERDALRKDFRRTSVSLKHVLKS